jgi:hypothetical protein
MNTAKEIARHIREIHTGNNWTDSCLKDVLQDVTFKEAIAKPIEANTIAMLVFHMNFYLNVVHGRLNRNNTAFNQEDSFAVPSIHSEEEWQQLVSTTFEDAEAFAKAVEQLTDADLERNISKQHGSFYKNLHGVVEHNHYHLGQIVLLKKIIRK